MIRSLCSLSNLNIQIEDDDDNGDDADEGISLIRVVVRQGTGYWAVKY